MKQLENKVVLITGADGKLGSGISREFARAGATVIVHSLVPNELGDTLVENLRGLGNKVGQVFGNVCSDIEVAAMIENIENNFGRIDVLINNAGIQPVISFMEMTLEQWKQVIDVNLNGTFIVSKQVMKHMIAKGVGGCIINIASVEASVPAMNHAHYDASKAGVKMFTRNLALELGRYGIRVNSVSPGLIDSDGSLADEWPAGYNSWMKGVPLQRTANPKDIGRACVFLSSDSAEFITGHDLVVDGGMSAVAGW